MSSFTMYKLSTAEQLDLFYTMDGKLSLEAVSRAMNEKVATIGSDGRISGMERLKEVL